MRRQSCVTLVRATAGVLYTVAPCAWFVCSAGCYYSYALAQLLFLLEVVAAAAVLSSDSDTLSFGYMICFHEDMDFLHLLFILILFHFISFLSFFSF